MSRIVLEGVTKVFGNDVVAVDDVSLEIGDGEFMVLVGPSGCGKSTILRILAGLEEVTAGEIFIGDVQVTDLPPKQRDIAMVFQNYALYPHMSVEQNLGFGLKLRKMPKDERSRRVLDVARILGLDSLMERKPAELSGGQRQRVAMGRAMVREPQAFLMDEPLSNLDAKLRVQMRAQFAKLHERLRTTTVYVTHDQVEAMTLGQRVAVLRDGLLQQVDTPQRIYRHPANLFVAAFIGSPPMNLVGAEISGGVVRFAGFEIPLPAGTPFDRLEGNDVILGIRPPDLEDADVWSGQGLPTIEVVAEVTEELGIRGERPVHRRRATGRDRRDPRRDGGGAGRDPAARRGVAGRDVRPGRPPDDVRARRSDPPVPRPATLPLLRSPDRAGARAGAGRGRERLTEPLAARPAGTLLG